LHGHEHPGTTRDVRGQVSFVIKAFVAGSPELDLAEEHGADAILLDSAEPGSGQVFDWRLAEGAPSGVRLLLAGGLNPENVGDAIAARLPDHWVMRDGHLDTHPYTDDSSTP
jgi:phosphoribosylanthranilate isomerase